MSQPSSITAITPAPISARADVQAAIARAAQATGVDFNYLLAQARLESGLDPEAHAQSSSAAGLYQFTRGTWAQTLSRHGADHGLGWAAGAAGGGAAARAQIMALRYDPQASAMMAAELTSDNKAALTATLGRAPDPSELYLAHFLGAGGAGKFLSAMNADPSQSAAALLPSAAAANHTIFFTQSGAPRSLGQVMAVLRGKVDAAMAGNALPDALPSADFGLPAGAGDFAALNPGLIPPDPLPARTAQGPLAQEFADAAAAAPPPASMAQTLAATFGSGGGSDAMPANVRAAYGQLQAFGL